MKNFFLTVINLLLIGSIHAQVGVNTETPATTLHVVPTRTDAATAEGIIAPNLKRSEVIAKDGRYAIPQTGAMIYVSDLSGTPTIKTANITSTGYYYFDGTIWQPFTNGAMGSVTDANNGLAMSGTTVQLGGVLTKATSITGGYNLTLATPTTVSGILQVSSGTPGTGKVLTSDASGNATWTALPAVPAPTVTTASNGLTMNGTTVQLGGALTAATSITGTSVLTLATPLKITGSTYGTNRVLTSDASGNATWAVAPVTTASNGLTMNGTTTQLGGALVQATSITGTSRLTLATPTTISGTLQVSSGTPGTGRVLTSDASGNATWAVAPVTTASNGLTMNGTTVQLGGSIVNTTISGGGRLTLANSYNTISGDLQYSGHGAAKGMVLSSDANGNATWQNQNMLSGSWFYLPSINLDMSTTTSKTVDLFAEGIQQLIQTPMISSNGGGNLPTLPTTASAYEYMVVGNSGHVVITSILSTGVMYYRPTTTNPPPFAYLNIVVRVK